MMQSRSLTRPLSTVVILLAMGCGPTTSSSTRYDCLLPGGETGQGVITQSDTNAIFSINGGPPNGPTGVNSCVPQPVLALPAAHFDFAVDIEGMQASVLPPSLVSSAGSAGWMSLDTTYELVTDAPTCCYNDSLPLLVAPGSVFLVQALTAGCSALPYQSQRYVYSKYVIDSIHYYPYNAVTAPSGMAVFYRMVTDPVCGYTSFATGIPPH